MNTFQIRSEGFGYNLIDAPTAPEALSAFEFFEITPLSPDPSSTPEYASAVDANGIRWEAVPWPPAPARAAG